MRRENISTQIYVEIQKNATICVDQRFTVKISVVPCPASIIDVSNLKMKILHARNRFGKPAHTQF